MNQNKLDTIIEKLDKVIELLTTNITKEKINTTPLSVTSSNEHSLQSEDINKALHDLKRMDKRYMVTERNDKGKLLRTGRLNSDNSIEWTVNYN